MRFSRIFVCCLVGVMLLQETYSFDDNKNNAGRGIERSSEETESESNDIDSGGEEVDQCTEKLIEDKWTFVFNLYDLSHDRILDNQDLAIQGNVYMNVYNLSGFEAHSFKEQLHKYWSCITFQGIDSGLSKANLVAKHTQSYKQNKTWTVQQTRECLDILVDVVDHDKNGFLSFDEVAVMYKMYNLGNRKLIEKRYKMICPVSKRCCPKENASEFLTNLLIGDDAEEFDACMDVYDQAGIPSEEYFQ